MAQYAAPAKITYITTRRAPDRQLTVFAPAGSVRRDPVRNEGGRSQTLNRSVYRRRRLVAAGAFLLAIAAVLVLAQLIQAGIGGGPLTATGAAATSGGDAAMIPAGTRDYIVQPGDTLWSIAGRVDTGGDIRPLVDDLDQELHGQVLYPGERVAIPNHW
jgi:nucleoid-associated protein YgaU